MNDPITQSIDDLIPCSKSINNQNVVPQVVEYMFEFDQRCNC